MSSEVVDLLRAMIGNECVPTCSLDFTATTNGYPSSRSSERPFCTNRSWSTSSQSSADGVDTLGHVIRPYSVTLSAEELAEGGKPEHVGLAGV